MTATTTPSRVSPCVWLFLLAAFVRLSYLFIVRPPFESWYWKLATSLIQDGSLALDGVKTTDFEPLYPLFLAAVRVLARDQILIVQAAQGVMASVGAIYLYRLAYALTEERSIATVAALLYAFHPVLIRQSVAAGDLALATTLLVAFAFYAVTGVTNVRMAVAGLVLGLLLLARTMTLPLVPLAAAVLMVQRRVRAALVLVIAAVVLVLPLTVRTWSVNGSWWPTRGGLNLYIGNSPFTSALLPRHDLDLLEARADLLIERDLSHLSNDAPEFSRAVDVLLTREALSYMAEAPVRTLGRKVLNVAYFFSPVLVPYDIAAPETRVVVDRSGGVVVENAKPRPLVEHVAYSAFYAPVLVAALVGIYLRRRDLSRDALLWCIVATFVAVHTVYFPATRYRAPMDFVLLFYAAVAVLSPTWKRRRGESNHLA